MSALIPLVAVHHSKLLSLLLDHSLYGNLYKMSLIPTFSFFPLVINILCVTYFCDVINNARPAK